MATTFYLRKISGAACGAGTRRKLLEAQGTNAFIQTLAATGDTWNLPALAATGTTHGPGAWTANIFLANIGFGGATCNLVIAHYSAACAELLKLVDEDLAVVGRSYTQYNFSGTGPQIYLAQNDLLMAILTAIAGTVSVEYEQPGIVVSQIAVPDVVTARPHEYYKRNRRRRSA